MKTYLLDRWERHPKLLEPWPTRGKKRGERKIKRQLSITGIEPRGRVLLKHDHLVRDHTYLKAESTGLETRFGVGQDPGRNETAADETGDDHSSSTTDPL